MLKRRGVVIAGNGSALLDPLHGGREGEEESMQLRQVRDNSN